MNTTLFGVIPIFTFPLMVGIGAGLGLIWSLWSVADHPEIAQLRMNTGTAALAGAAISGRAGYVLVNWTYFQRQLVEIPQVWLGGLSWTGALAGALLAVTITAGIQRTHLGDLVDGLRPLLTCIVVSTWLAGWMTGHAYGVEVDAWWGIPALDEWGYITLRWPTQLAGAFSATGIHWLLDQLRDRKRISIPGTAASLELAGICLTIVALSPYRADPALLWRGIRTDTWASIGFFILSILMAFGNHKSTIIRQNKANHLS